MRGENLNSIKTKNCLPNILLSLYIAMKKEDKTSCKIENIACSDINVIGWLYNIYNAIYPAFCHEFIKSLRFLLRA